MSKLPLVDDPQNVEDVLSSIRKLVSEETRARGGAGLSGHANKLVLTPELRITDEHPEPLRLDTPVSADTDAVSNSDAPFHDEVALRALVSELIREELQGELGARITRNVRKLIKREIDDALSNSGRL